MKRIILKVAGVLLLLAGLIYLGDYLALRYPIPAKREQFGTVNVRPLYVIHEKNGKTEYDFAQPEAVSCVRSLFPHFGYAPCWYLNRHTQKRIDI